MSLKHDSRWQKLVVWPRVCGMQLDAGIEIVASPPAESPVQTEPAVLHEHRLKLIEWQGMMSNVTPLRSEIPGAARSGADLRAARERLG
jgi:hypothetical protein